MKHFSTWDICRDVECRRRTKAFGGWCSYRQLVCDAWVKHWKQMMSGVGGQRHGESWSLKRDWRVVWTEAAVADLSRREETESQLIFGTSIITAVYNYPKLFCLLYLILYDDPIWFSWFLPVKKDPVFKWSGSQRLAGYIAWNCWHTDILVTDTIPSSVLNLIKHYSFVYN